MAHGEVVARSDRNPEFEKNLLHTVLNNGTITFPRVAPKVVSPVQTKEQHRKREGGTDMRTFLDGHVRSLLIMHTAIVCGLFASVLLAMR
jgi:hypothetical protein